MKKLKLLTILMTIAILPVFSGCGKNDETLKTVNLNEVVHSIFYAPQYVAIQMGFFEEEGLSVNLTAGQGADKSMTALISKDADIALLGTEAGLYVYSEGRDDYAVSFAQLTQRAGNFLVARGPMENFTWQDLKGKTVIGGRAGGMPQMMLEYILRENGIDPKNDVEILTNLQFTTTAGAFTGGVGDFTLEFEPSALALENAGRGYVVASLGADSGIVPYTVYMATKSYVAENPEVIQKFTNAIYRGQQWVDTHTSEEIAEVIFPFFKESTLDDLEIMTERYKSQGTWRSDPVFDEECFNLLQDIMISAGELSEKVPFDELIVTSFSQKAVDTVKFQ